MLIYMLCAVVSMRLKVPAFPRLLIALQGWFALFISAQEIYLCKDDSFSWLSRYVWSSLLIFKPVLLVITRKLSQRAAISAVLTWCS